MLQFPPPDPAWQLITTNNLKSLNLYGDISYKLLGFGAIQIKSIFPILAISLLVFIKN